MIVKMCPRCGSKYEYGQACKNECYDKAKKESSKVYDKSQRKNKEFYHSTEWVRLTMQCKSKFNGLDIYQYFKYNKIVPGTLSHHIIEVEEDESRALDINNLIYLSVESHSEVHKIYGQSEDGKRELQELLFRIVETY